MRSPMKLTSFNSAFHCKDLPECWRSAATLSTRANTTSNSGAGFMSALMGKGIKVNVAVLGVDEGETRTDVIFVVHFDSKAKNLILFPFLGIQRLL